MKSITVHNRETCHSVANAVKCRLQ